ncbi:MAG: helix-turn-helix domain-containing protein [Dehalococcoidia bacterium]
MNLLPQVGASDYLVMRGAEMQAWREARKMSRRKLAQSLDVAEGTIYRWEKEQRQMPSRIIELALKGLDVELAETEGQQA